MDVERKIFSHPSLACQFNYIFNNTFQKLMKPYLLHSYKKCVQVIDSCTTPSHIIGARRYINNFFTMYSEPGGRVGPLSLIRATDAVAHSYTRLLGKIYEKEKTLE
jgi:hypothetical protein